VSWIFSLITRPPVGSVKWADAHLDEVDAARAAYDARALRAAYDARALRAAELPWRPVPSPAP
jgi:hypothetical protein